MGTAEMLAIAAGVVASEMSKDDKAGASDECPADLKGNECDYYKDGYKAGADDRCSRSVRRRSPAGAAAARRRRTPSTDVHWET
jgi:hypothetical protein